MGSIQKVNDYLMQKSIFFITLQNEKVRLHLISLYAEHVKYLKARVYANDPESAVYVDLYPTNNDYQYLDSIGLILPLLLI